MRRSEKTFERKLKKLTDKVPHKQDNQSDQDCLNNIFNAFLHHHQTPFYDYGFDVTRLS